MISNDLILNVFELLVFLGDKMFLLSLTYIKDPDDYNKIYTIHVIFCSYDRSLVKLRYIHTPKNQQHQQQVSELSS